MKNSCDIKTGVNAVVGGVAKTQGHEAQTGTYELLYREMQNPSCPPAPLPVGWIEQRIRASSVWSWVDCPHRAAAEHIQGKHKPANARMHLGTTIHKATAVFDLARVENKRPSVSDAIDTAVETLWHPEEEVTWGDETPKLLEPIARKCTREYCTKFSPGIKFAGVEETLADLPIDIPEERVRILLTGTQDRLRRSVESQGDVSCAEIIGIKTTKKPEIALGRIIEPEKVLLGDGTHGGYLQYLAHMIRTGNFIGNPRSMFCSKKSCPIYPCFYVR